MYAQPRANLRTEAIHPQIGNSWDTSRLGITHARTVNGRIQGSETVGTSLRGGRFRQAVATPRFVQRRAPGERQRRQGGKRTNVS